MGSGITDKNKKQQRSGVSLLSMYGYTGDVHNMKKKSNNLLNY